MRATWLAFGLSLLALMAGAALGAPNALTSVLAPAAAPPTLISYQGFVKVGGNAYTGTGYFKFAVMDAASGNGTTNYWANDGAASGEPAALVSLAVTGGLFDVMLGDTSLAGMTQAITQNSFNQTNTYLRVWFSQTAAGPFQALDPNQRIGSAAYALRATRADSAADADSLGGVAAASYLQTTSSLNAPNLVGVAPLASIPAIPWSNLTSVPAGFADNVDNDTTYAAGSNLTLTGNTFALTSNVAVNSLTTTGNVGIGTASPATTLDVAGPIKVGGSLATCSSAGMVRWTGTTLDVCDGAAWTTINTSGNRKAFRARPSASISNITGGQVVTFGVEDYDDANAFNGTTYTVPSGAGTLYHFECRLLLVPATDPGTLGVLLQVNGVAVAEAIDYASVGGIGYLRQVSADLKLVAGQQVKCFSYFLSGGSGPLISGAISPNAGNSNYSIMRGYWNPPVGTVFSGYLIY